MFFYLSKLFFWSFPQFKSNFLNPKNHLKYRGNAPLLIIAETLNGVRLSTTRLDSDLKMSPRIGLIYALVLSAAANQQIRREAEFVSK